MSLYRYFASINPLPTVQRKPLMEDFLFNKSIELEANGENSIITLEEHNLLNQFEVLPCRKNPPVSAGGQIQKPKIYKVRGNTNDTFLNQLVDYIKENVEEQNREEFWSIWHSEKVPSKNIHRINPQQITIEDLRILNQNENCCIKFFPKNNK